MSEIEVKGLSVKQPWAYAIAELGKRIENRSRRTNYYGRIAIHAPLKTDLAAAMPTPDAQEDLTGARLRREPRLHAAGQIIAVALLVGCHKPNGGDCGRPGSGLCTPWSQADAWHWQLEDVRLCGPVNCTGARGLFRLPQPVIDAAFGYIPVDADGNPVPLRIVGD